MIELLFSLLMINNDQLQFKYAVALSRSYNFDGSQKILKTINLKQIKNKDVYCYYRMLNGFYLNDKKEVAANIDKLENDFFDIPERYKAMVNILREEIKYWKKDDIGDIGRDMRQVQNKLRAGNASNKTQKMQKEIVDRLTKLIDKLENKNNQSNDKDKQEEKDGEKQNEKNKNNQSNDKDKQEEKDGEKQNENRSTNQNPLPDSKIINEGGKGTVNHVRFKNLRERWGTLPPKEQQKALQEILRNMPERYRLSIENYFRNLGKRN